MFIFKFFMALQVAVYRWTGGKLGGQMGKNKIILLTTTGRKSGKNHTVPLGCFERDGGYVIVASNGGADKNPAWFFNLKSNPNVMAQMEEQIFPAQAEILSGDARAKAWQQVTSTSPGYANYEKKTSREIPLVLLHPMD